MTLYRLAAAAVVAVACACAQNYPGTPTPRTTTKSTLARWDSNELDVPTGQGTLHGILFDAGCQDRVAMNLRKPPETLREAAPAEPATAAQNNPPPTGAVSAKGISVNSATIAAERGSVMETHVPGMFERQSDPTCAITASTTSFAILTDGGRLLDLDSGGNTLALIAVQSTGSGRAMLNGQGPGVKPRVVVKGQFQSGHLIVKDLKAES